MQEQRFVDSEILVSSCLIQRRVDTNLAARESERSSLLTMVVVQIGSNRRWAGREQSSVWPPVKTSLSNEGRSQLESGSGRRVYRSKKRELPFRRDGLVTWPFWVKSGSLSERPQTVDRESAGVDLAEALQLVKLRMLCLSPNAAPQRWDLCSRKCRSIQR